MASIKPTLSNKLMKLLMTSNVEKTPFYRRLRHPMGAKKPKTKEYRYNTPHQGSQECAKRLRNYPSLNLATFGH